MAVNVPPQLLVGAGAAATSKPTGRVSVKLTPVKGVLDGFCRLMVKVETDPAVIVAGEKLLLTPIEAILIEAGAVATFCAPALVVSPPTGMVLVNIVVERFICAVTGTTTVQVFSVGGVALAGMVPPARTMLPLPALAVRVPPQLLTGAGEEPTTRPAGKVSVKPAPVYGLPDGLRRVMVSKVVSPAASVPTAKPLISDIPVMLMLAGAATTFLAPSAVVNAPAGMLLFNVVVERLIAAMTGTTKVQVFSVGGVALAGIVPPLKLMVPAPATAVNVPPQLLTAAGDAATVNPAGRVSLTATPVKGSPLGFCKVIVNRLVLPGAIGDVPKDLIRLTDCTVMLALTSAFVAPCVVVRAPAGMVLDKVAADVLNGEVTRTVIKQVP